MTLVNNYTAIVVNKIMAETLGVLHSESIAPQIAIINPVPDMRFKDGEDVWVPKIGTSTRRTKVPGAPYVWDAATMTKTNIGIPSQVYRPFSVSLNDMQLIATGEAQLGLHIKEAMDGLREDIDNILFAAVTNLTQSVTASSGLDDAAIRAARLILRNNKVTKKDCHLVTSPDVYDDIIDIAKNPSYNETRGVGAPAQQAVTMAEVNYLRNFRVWESPEIEVTAGSPDVHNCVALQRGALCLQFLRLHDTNNVPAAFYQGMSENGIPLRTVVTYDKDYELYQFRVETAVVAGVMWDEKGVRIEVNV